MLIQPASFYPKHLTVIVLSSRTQRFCGVTTATRVTIISSFPGAFNRSLGNLGQSEEVTLYGRGFNNISVFNDGMLLNNRTSNNFDFNLMQTESADSIEIVPLPRGFMYGTKNNPVSVNIIPSSRTATVPYSRIKFYQAPNGEGMIDARFNQRVFRKAQLSLDMTNRKIDASFNNSDYSLWIIKAGLMIPLNNHNDTIITDFSHERLVTGLFGGINVDSVAQWYNDVTSAVYSPVQAFPNYAYRYQKQHQNSVSVTLNTSYIKNSPGSLRFYYRDDLTEYRQNEHNQTDAQDRIVFNRTGKAQGLTLTQSFSLPLFSLQVNGGYEKTSVHDMYSFFENQSPVLYGGASLNSDLFDSTISTSLFVKYTNVNGTSYKGAGADMQIDITDAINLYAGYSAFEKAKNYSYEPEKNQFHTAEVKLRSHAKPFQFEWSLFYSSGSKAADGTVQVYPDTGNGTIFISTADEPVYGTGLSLTAQYAFLQLETTASYIKETVQNKSINTLPAISGSVGLYYRGVHFDSSLVIKAGVQGKFYSDYTPLQYDYFYTRTYYDPAVKKLNGNFILNLVIVGEIKKSAIVYFTWENLFDSRYYQTQFYPMPGRGMRFGLSWELFN